MKKELTEVHVRALVRCVAFFTTDGMRGDPTVVPRAREALVILERIVGEHKISRAWREKHPLLTDRRNTPHGQREDV